MSKPAKTSATTGKAAPQAKAKEAVKDAAAAAADQVAQDKPALKQPETAAKPAEKAVEKPAGNPDTKPVGQPVVRPVSGDPVAAKPAVPKPDEKPTTLKEPATPPANPDQPAKPAAASKPTPAAPQQVVEVRKGGFVPTALGGVVAAGLGAGAMWFGMPNLPEQYRPEGLSAPVAEAPTPVDYAPQIAAAKAEALDAAQGVAGRVEALAADLEALKSAPAAEGGAALTAQIAELQAALAAQTSQIAALESRPAPTGVDPAAVEAAAIAAARAQADQMMGDLRAQMDQQRAKAAEEQAAAETAAQKARAQAAVAGLSAALKNGTALAGPLAALSEAGITAPPALTAEVPTLETLQTSFAPAARAALAAAAPVEAEGQGALGRVTAFFKAQTGARSVGGRVRAPMPMPFCRAPRPLWPRETCPPRSASLAHCRRWRRMRWRAG